MDAVYSRAKDLREKVESVMLKKIEWRVLFSVDGKRTVSDIASKVERDEDTVDEILQKLADEKLIAAAKSAAKDNGAKETKKTVKEEAPKKAKESKPEVKEKAPEVKPAPKKEEKKEEKKEAVDFASMMEETPKAEPKVEKAAAKPAAPVAAVSGGKKILVVDDSIVIQKMVEIALENDHYPLTSAMKGEDGIRMAKEMQPSLILLDMMLPDMSGIDVMKAIRELGGAFTTLPIVVLSGKDSPQDKDSAIGSGATDFLTKPFHDEDLLSKVHEYLGK